MKKKNYVVAIVALSAAMAFSATAVPGISNITTVEAEAATSYTGLKNMGNGVWQYYKNGKKVTTGTDIVKNQYGWWYIKNGKVDFSYNGFAKNDYGWWYITNGKVTFNDNSVIQGTVNGTTAWWYVSGSKVQFTDTVASNKYGWWYIKNGKVDFSYNGFAKNNNGWWYITNGKVTFNDNSVIQGTVDGTKAWWYVKGSKVQFTDTVASNKYGWWYIKNGKVDFSYNGLAKNDYGWWYIKNGKVDFSYNGSYDYDGTIYIIENGKVVDDSAMSIDYDNVYFDYSDQIDAELAEVSTVPEAADIEIKAYDDFGATGVELVSSYDDTNTTDYYLNAMVAYDPIIIEATGTATIKSVVSTNPDSDITVYRKKVRLYPQALQVDDDNNIADEVFTVTMSDGTVYKIHTLNEMMPGLTITGEGYASDSDEGVYTMCIDKFLLRVDSEKNILYYRNMDCWGTNQIENFAPQDDGCFSYFAELHTAYRNDNGGYSSGVYYTMDCNYVENEEPITLLANDDPNHTHGEGYLDQHEYVEIEDGHYLLLSYTLEHIDNLPEDLEGIDGTSEAWVWAGIFQEVKNGEVINEIDTTDYPKLYSSAVEKIDYASSTAVDENTSAKGEVARDYVHPNSIDYTLDADGNVDKLLVSMRDQSAVYQFSMQTGSCDWILGGKASTLTGYEEYTSVRTDDNGVEFDALTFGQHYARYMDSEDGTTKISLFDNQTGTAPFLYNVSFSGSYTNNTRVFTVSIDEDNNTATVDDVIYGQNLNALTGKYHQASHCGSVNYCSDTSVSIGWGLHGMIDNNTLYGIGMSNNNAFFKSLAAGCRPIVTDYDPASNTINFELSAVRSAVKAQEVAEEGSNEGLFSYRTYKTPN